jgi:hypothetical protein
MTGPQIVVVTGGSAGIGRAAALAFARRGDWVAVLARNAERVEAACNEIRGLGGTALGICVDVADAAALEAAADRIERELGLITVWVNNVATTVFGRVLVKSILSTRVLPGLGDWVAARQAYDGQMTDEPALPSRPDTLFEPVAGPFGTHGRFGAASLSAREADRRQLASPARARPYAQRFPAGGFRALAPRLAGVPAPAGRAPACVLRRRAWSTASSTRSPPGRSAAAGTSHDGLSPWLSLRFI